MAAAPPSRSPGCECSVDSQQLFMVATWPGLEDRPSNFGSPQRFVWSLGGADEVVLTNRPLDGERMLCHVISEGAVGSVDFGVGTEMDGHSELRWRDHGGTDTSDLLRQRIAWNKDRDLPPVVGEEL